MTARVMRAAVSLNMAVEATRDMYGHVTVCSPWGLSMEVEGNGGRYCQLEFVCNLNLLGEGPPSMLHIRA